MNEYLKLFKEIGLDIRSEYLGNSVEMEFYFKKCGHSFKSLPKSVKRNYKNGGFSCPVCMLKQRTMTFSEVKKIVSDSTQREYKVISKSKDYKSTRSEIQILHKTCGEVTNITYKNFSLGRRCRHCAAKTMNSKASQLLKRLLTQINIEFIEEFKFDDCINPITGRQLPFDFYIPKINRLIEIDGEQHFIPVQRFGGEKALKENKYRDFIKNKYAYTKDIDLVRVSLLDENLKKRKYDDLKIIIFNLLYEISEKYYKES